ncbi:Tetratricopeptide repeat-containing protein [Desulfuromusa kysingii]|uniref:Tetratricopeptide repeat-containing protein n=1 Tax=Desulfuromusa kysingii TaxID=37625 RepID=A0A1H3YE59_9BACT|nr:tetratricopeptide repeat protein [Desulfuromusa kysingii]SEA09192.1 Tetratricopeptide repeat-containing protein [Desulfuromusa kysingii]
MKKETLLFVIVALAAGILIGVIVTNLKKDLPPSAPVQQPVPVSAPVVNQQQQTSILEGIVTREPENRNAWVELGHNFFDSDQPMKAIEAYSKALDLNGNDPDLLTDQGVMFRRVGWYDRAIKNFEEASRIDRHHKQSLYNLGIVYRYDLQDFPKAIRAWEQLLAIDPDNPGASQIRAELDFLKNHPEIPKQSQ